MLHLKFILAWFCSPLGLRSSVEKGFVCIYRHAVRYATRKDGVAYLRHAGSGACMTISTGLCIPIGMRFTRLGAILNILNTF
jgi:hypothetical protein